MSSKSDGNKKDFKAMTLTELRNEFERIIAEEKLKGYTDIGLGSVRVPNNPTGVPDVDERLWLESVLKLISANNNGEYEEICHITPFGERIDYSKLDTQMLRLVFAAYGDMEKRKGLISHSFTRNHDNYRGLNDEEVERKDMIAIMSMHDCYLNCEHEIISSVSPRNYRFVEKSTAIDVTETFN